MQAAKDHLEKALQVTATKGCAVTDSEIAEHHYKLGRVMWIMGGNLRSSPKYARRHFEAASMEENDWQVRARLPGSGPLPGSGWVLHVCQYLQDGLGMGPCGRPGYAGAADDRSEV